MSPVIVRGLAGLLVAAALAAPAMAQQRAAGSRTADYIAAVVNQELVTAGELNQRMALLRAESSRNGQRLPADAELRAQVLDALIDERVILSHARDSGIRVEEPELDRAVASVASQNQITLAQLRERLRQQGVDYARFRNNVRDQLLIERAREREVQQRIRITDAEIDAFLDGKRGAAASAQEMNLAQILVPVPEGASEAVVAERQAVAEAALVRVRGGEGFAGVARAVSEDANRERGGEIGLRPVDRLPDVFVETVRALKPGEVAPALLRTGAGFHVLKLVERRDNAAFKVTQTRARHILLRPSAQASATVVAQRVAEFRRQIESGQRRFEDVAREHSEDGSAAQGGDLGWTAPGSFVPEFEQALNSLAVGGLSAPVSTRFGVHLIQVAERREVAVDAKQLREQARTALREQKFEPAYLEWVRELRANAYVELREESP
jgi:peptidyl-prolyl cis-trans isomerase SurA